MYVETLCQKLPPLKKSKLSKKSQKGEDKIKRRLTEANKEWNDWKFQVHWNKIEWLNPRISDEIKNTFYVSLKKCFKDNVKPANWVGQFKIKILIYRILLKKSTKI